NLQLRGPGRRAAAWRIASGGYIPPLRRRGWSFIVRYASFHGRALRFPVSSLSLQASLFLLMARGLPAEAAWLAATDAGALGLNPGGWPQDPAARARLETELRQRGYLRGRAGVEWPEPRRVEAAAQRFGRAGLKLVW